MTKPSTSAAGLSERARQRVPWWRRIFRRAKLDQHVDEGQLLARFVFDDAAAECVHAAFAYARQRKFGAVTIVDFLWAMVQRGLLDTLLKETEIDPESFEPEPRMRESTEDVYASPYLVELFEWTAKHARAAGRDSIQPLHVFVMMYQYDDVLAQDLTELGIDALTAMTFASHGVGQHPFYDDKTAPPGDELDIVIHNDDFTTQDVVVDLLMQALGVDTNKATHLMLLIHESADQEVAVMPRAEAIELANEMLRAAREAEVPLKVSLRSA